MSITGNPQNPPALFLRQYCLWLPSAFYMESNLLLLMEKVSIVQGSVRSTQAGTTLLHIEHTYSFLPVSPSLCCTPCWNILQRSHFLGAKQRKLSSPPYVKSRVLAVITRCIFKAHVYNKELYFKTLLAEGKVD